MSSITPKRKRLTLEQKIQIIEESEVPGFKPKKATEKYGISLPAVYKILKEKDELLKTFNLESLIFSSSQSYQINEVDLVTEYTSQIFGLSI